MVKTMKEAPKEYLQSIGLENVIGEEFFNDDDKSYYTVEELMQSYAEAENKELEAQNQTLNSNVGYAEAENNELREFINENVLSLIEFSEPRVHDELIELLKH